MGAGSCVRGNHHDWVVWMRRGLLSVSHSSVCYCLPAEHLVKLFPFKAAPLRMEVTGQVGAPPPCPRVCLRPLCMHHGCVLWAVLSTCRACFPSRSCWRLSRIPCRSIQPLRGDFVRYLVLCLPPCVPLCPFAPCGCRAPVVPIALPLGGALASLLLWLVGHWAGGRAEVHV